MLKTVVCVSGGGTNLQAILDAIDHGTITNTQIMAVISNNAGAYALERARNKGIEAICMSPKSYSDRAAFNEAFTAKMKELNPDLVTLDITMPKMDGIEALMLIKKYNENAEAVMITAAGQKEKMIQAVKYGASEFITKPYESDEVERIIAQILN